MSCSSGAHPRRCGEHHTIIRNLDAAVGSSPQVRGTFPDLLIQVDKLGLIPAGAGNIFKQAGGRTQIQAHPRRCGEHPGWVPRAKLPSGSSPQVRGTCPALRLHLGEFGLIPAGAGNILWSSRCRAPTRAHPRRCGEHRALPGDGVDAHGLIPAGAGNIASSRSGNTPHGAHPRRCGEHPRADASLLELNGSSPQVRGTFRRRLRRRDDLGLIPAGAGNIGSSSPCDGLLEAHPRRCGEHQGAVSDGATLWGSSPQVRGT